MKKGVYFFLGLLSGVILTLIVSFIIGKSIENRDDANGADTDVSWFEEPGEIMYLKSFEILQVFPDGYALALTSGKAKVQYKFEYGDPVVLLTPDKGKSYYDDQVITVPQGMCVRQAGTYRYETKDEFIKTVPVVLFYEK